MKSEVVPSDGNIEWEYPSLGYMETDSRLVVLFQSDNQGTVVSSDGNITLGLYAEDWDMNDFLPLPPGTQVILTQE